MSRRAIPLAAALAAACALSLTPAPVAASAAGPDAGGPVLVDPSTRSALVAEAQKQSPQLVKALGLTAQDGLVVKDVLKDADGTTHVRADRTHRGLRVVGGDVVVDRAPDGRVTGSHGTFVQPLTLDVKPGIAASAARSKGVAAARSAQHSEELKTVAPKDTTLVVLVGGVATPTLAYEVTTTGMRKDQTPSRVKAYIDADTGKVLGAHEQIKNGTGRGIFVGTVPLDTARGTSGYELRNPTTGNYTTDLLQNEFDPDTTSGPAGTLFTDSDDSWGTGSQTNRQSAAVDAQFGADTTFRFYKNVMGRNGIWNDGSGARSRVHYGNNYSNAWWDGQQMTYGDGANNANPLVELDVAAHEMTHGVTENTAGLVYQGDAGGLNEASSDILGSAVEWYAGLSSDVPDYRLGELIDINGDGTPLRYMDKPSKDGWSPDCWSSSTASLDPHAASGPLNHWYYLASEGSGSKTINGVGYSSPTCNSSSVTGAGHGNVEKVWYRTLATKLTSYSTYKDAREGAITSAVELYGADSQTCRSVQSAFSAIGVPAGRAACSTAPSPTPPPTPTPTPTPTPIPGTSVVVNGGFENGQTGWTGTDGPINDDSRRPARTGSWKMWLLGNGASTTETEEQKVTVPTGGKLTFFLAVDTAEGTTRAYDTMRVQVVKSSGTATTVGTYSNMDRSSGYVLRTIDLSAYAGQTVTLRFTGTEDASYQTSFVVDDVVLK